MSHDLQAGKYAFGVLSPLSSPQEQLVVRREHEHTEFKWHQQARQYSAFFKLLEGDAQLRTSHAFDMLDPNKQVLSYRDNAFVPLRFPSDLTSVRYFRWMESLTGSSFDVLPTPPTKVVDCCGMPTCTLLSSSKTRADSKRSSSPRQCVNWRILGPSSPLMQRVTCVTGSSTLDRVVTRHVSLTQVSMVLNSDDTGRRSCPSRTFVKNCTTASGRSGRIYAQLDEYHERKTGADQLTMMDFDNHSGLCMQETFERINNSERMELPWLLDPDAWPRSTDEDFRGQLACGIDHLVDWNFPASSDNKGSWRGSRRNSDSSLAEQCESSDSSAHEWMEHSQEAFMHRLPGPAGVRRNKRRKQPVSRIRALRKSEEDIAAIRERWSTMNPLQSRELDLVSLGKFAWRFVLSEFESIPKDQYQGCNSTRLSRHNLRTGTHDRIMQSRPVVDELIRRLLGIVVPSSAATASPSVHSVHTLGSVVDDATSEEDAHLSRFMDNVLKEAGETKRPPPASQLYEHMDKILQRMPEFQQLDEEAEGIRLRRLRQDQERAQDVRCYQAVQEWQNQILPHERVAAALGLPVVTEIKTLDCDRMECMSEIAPEDELTSCKTSATKWQHVIGTASRKDDDECTCVPGNRRLDCASGLCRHRRDLDLIKQRSEILHRDEWCQSKLRERSREQGGHLHGGLSRLGVQLLVTEREVREASSKHLQALFELGMFSLRTNLVDLVKMRFAVWRRKDHIGQQDHYDDAADHTQAFEKQLYKLLMEVKVMEYFVPALETTAGFCLGLGLGGETAPTTARTSSESCSSRFTDLVEALITSVIGRHIRPRYVAWRDKKRYRESSEEERKTCRRARENMYSHVAKKWRSKQLVRRVCGYTIYKSVVNPTTSVVHPGRRAGSIYQGLFAGFGPYRPSWTHVLVSNMRRSDCAWFWDHHRILLPCEFGSAPNSMFMLQPLTWQDKSKDTSVSYLAPTLAAIDILPRPTCTIADTGIIRFSSVSEFVDCVNRFSADKKQRKQQYHGCDVKIVSSHEKRDSAYEQEATLRRLFFDHVLLDLDRPTVHEFADLLVELTRDSVGDAIEYVRSANVFDDVTYPRRRNSSQDVWSHVVWTAPSERSASVWGWWKACPISVTESRLLYVDSTERESSSELIAAEARDSDRFSSSRQTGYSKSFALDFHGRPCWTVVSPQHIALYGAPCLASAFKPTMDIAWTPMRCSGAPTPREDIWLRQFCTAQVTRYNWTRSDTMTAAAASCSVIAERVVIQSLPTTQVRRQLFCPDSSKPGELLSEDDDDDVMYEGDNGLDDKSLRVHLPDERVFCRELIDASQNLLGLLEQLTKAVLKWKPLADALGNAETMIDAMNRGLDWMRTHLRTTPTLRQLRKDIGRFARMFRGNGMRDFAQLFKDAMAEMEAKQAAEGVANVNVEPLDIGQLARQREASAVLVGRREDYADPDVHEVIEMETAKRLALGHVLAASASVQGGIQGVVYEDAFGMTKEEAQRLMDSVMAGMERLFAVYEKTRPFAWSCVYSDRRQRQACDGEWKCLGGVDEAHVGSEPVQDVKVPSMNSMKRLVVGQPSLEFLDGLDVVRWWEWLTLTLQENARQEVKSKALGLVHGGAQTECLSGTRGKTNPAVTGLAVMQYLSKTVSNNTWHYEMHKKMPLTRSLADARVLRVDSTNACGPISEFAFAWSPPTVSYAWANRERLEDALKWECFPCVSPLVDAMHAAVVAADKALLVQGGSCLPSLAEALCNDQVKCMSRLRIGHTNVTAHLPANCTWMTLSEDLVSREYQQLATPALAAAACGHKSSKMKPGEFALSKASDRSFRSLLALNWSHDIEVLPDLYSPRLRMSVVLDGLGRAAESIPRSLFCGPLYLANAGGIQPIPLWSMPDETYTVPLTVSDDHPSQAADGNREEEATAPCAKLNETTYTLQVTNSIMDRQRQEREDGLVDPALDHQHQRRRERLARRRRRPRADDDDDSDTCSDDFAADGHRLDERLQRHYVKRIDHQQEQNNKAGDADDVDNDNASQSARRLALIALRSIRRPAFVDGLGHGGSGTDCDTLGHSDTSDRCSCSDEDKDGSFASSHPCIVDRREKRAESRRTRRLNALATRDALHRLPKSVPAGNGKGTSWRDKISRIFSSNKDKSKSSVAAVKHQSGVAGSGTAAGKAITGTVTLGIGADKKVEHKTVLGAPKQMDRPLFYKLTWHAESGENIVTCVRIPADAKFPDGNPFGALGLNPGAASVSSAEDEEQVVVPAESKGDIKASQLPKPKPKAKPAPSSVPLVAESKGTSLYANKQHASGVETVVHHLFYHRNFTLSKYVKQELAREHKDADGKSKPLSDTNHFFFLDRLQGRTCPLCLRVTIAKNMRVLMPCQHKYCDKCVVDIHEKWGPCQCPECGRSDKHYRYKEAVVAPILFDEGTIPEIRETTSFISAESEAFVYRVGETKYVDNFMSDQTRRRVRECGSKQPGFYFHRNVQDLVVWREFCPSEIKQTWDHQVQNLEEVKREFPRLFTGVDLKSYTPPVFEVLVGAEHKQSSRAATIYETKSESKRATSSGAASAGRGDTKESAALSSVQVMDGKGDGKRASLLQHNQQQQQPQQRQGHDMADFSLPGSAGREMSSGDSDEEPRDVRMPLELLSTSDARHGATRSVTPESVRLSAGLEMIQFGLRDVDNGLQDLLAGAPGFTRSSSTRCAASSGQDETRLSSTLPKTAAGSIDYGSYAEIRAIASAESRQQQDLLPVVATVHAGRSALFDFKTPAPPAVASLVTSSVAASAVGARQQPVSRTALPDTFPMQQDEPADADSGLPFSTGAAGTLRARHAWKQTVDVLSDILLDSDSIKSDGAIETRRIKKED